VYPILFQIGNFAIHSYGFIVALSFFIGLWLSVREAERNGLNPQVIHEFALYALLGGIIGARIYFVLFSDPAFYLKNPSQILAVWRGGIGVIGSLAGGLLAGVWYCRKKNLSLGRLADILAPGIPLAQSVGQLACLLNGDSYGKPTNLPWAITYTDPRSFAPLKVPLHPIEIYEMVAYFLVFLLVWKTRKKYKIDGFAFLTYLVGYGVARFSVEFFRGNPAIFAWGVPAAQVFSAAMILASVAGFYLLGKGQEEARARKK